MWKQTAGKLKSESSASKLTAGWDGLLKRTKTGGTCSVNRMRSAHAHTCTLMPQQWDHQAPTNNSLKNAPPHPSEDQWKVAGKQKPYKWSAGLERVSTALLSTRTHTCTHTGLIWLCQPNQQSLLNIQMLKIFLLSFGRKKHSEWNQCFRSILTALPCLVFLSNVS